MQILIFTTLICAILVYLPSLIYRWKLAKLPAIDNLGEKQRQLYMKSAKQFYAEGLKKVGKSNFDLFSSLKILVPEHGISFYITH